MTPIVKSLLVNMSDIFPLQNGLTQDALLLPLSKFALELPFGRCKKSRRNWNWMEQGTIFGLQ